MEQRSLVRHGWLLKLAFGVLVVGVVARHAVTIDRVLLAPGMLADLVPHPRAWVVAGAILLLLSVVPWDLLFNRKRDPALDASRFKRESLERIKQRLMEMSLVSEPNIKAIVDYLLYQAIQRDASDIHLDPSREGYSVRFRVDGLMMSVGGIPPELTSRIGNRLKVLSNLKVYQGFLPQDGRLGSSSEGEATTGNESVGDFRIAFMPTMHGERVVIRILGRSSGHFELANLGLSEDHIRTLRRLVAQPQGMIILTGPTGSGKTTTIYAILQAILDSEGSKRSIATLEDPIEYEVPEINQSQVNEDKQFTFDRGLRAMLRQDPDVIMVGEIRDAETAKIALQAGMTGHLIITTVHANSTAATFARLLEMGAAPYALNSAVSAVIAQRLVRQVCITCRADRPIAPVEIDQLGLDPERGTSMTVFEGRGCAGCGGSGYEGRYALFEVLEVDEAVRELVSTGADTDRINAHMRETGMRTLFEAGVEAVAQGITTPEEVFRTVIASQK